MFQLLDDSEAAVEVDILQESNEGIKWVTVRKQLVSKFLNPGVKAEVQSQQILKWRPYLVLSIIIA